MDYLRIKRCHLVYVQDQHIFIWIIWISKDAIWFMHRTGIFSNLWPLNVTLTFEVWTRNMRATLRLMMLNIIVKRFLIPSTNSRVMLRTSKSGRTGQANPDGQTDRRTESAKSKCLPHKVGDIIISNSDLYYMKHYRKFACFAISGASSLVHMIVSILISNLSC